MRHWPFIKLPEHSKHIIILSFTINLFSLGEIVGVQLYTYIITNYPLKK